MDTLGQTALWVAVTSFSLGFSVLSRNVRNKLFLAFASLTTVVSAWSLTFFLEKIGWGSGFYQLHLFFNVLLGPVGLVFIRVLVRIQDSLSRRLLHGTSFLAAVLSVALLFQFDETIWVRQLIYFLPAVLWFQIIYLMWIDQRLLQGIKRIPKMPTVGLGRKNFIYFGGLLVLSLCFMDHIPELGVILPSVGNLSLAAYLFFLSQAITQQRLLNIGALFSRSLVLLVVALTLTALYSVLVAWIENSPGLFFLNSFIASFLILMLLDPLRTFVGYFTQRLLSQKHRKLQQTLREAQRRLIGIVDLGSLFQAVLQTSEQVFHPRWTAFFVLCAEGTKFRRVRSAGDEPVSLNGSSSEGVFKELLANHLILKHCEQQAKAGKFPVLLDQVLENEIDRSASRLQREYFGNLIEGLQALGCNLLIPLYDSGKILGFVTLLVPTPPEPWENNWGFLPVVYPYFEQVAQTMQNMEVYARRREKERLAALGEMAAGLAHEIRNPLGAIKGAAQFLDPSADRPESRFLKIIIEEVDRLNQVVTDFLDYSKPFSSEMVAVDLSKLSEKTVEFMRPSIRPELVLEVHSSREKAMVLASGEKMRQVLINLIQNAQNALESRSSGLIRVRVSVGGDFQDEGVVLSVEDTGVGIKKENLEKLFIPFFTTSPRGTGLGLSISQKIVEAHRGRMEVVSEEGRFTRVSVILPLLKE
ncbi:MAG: two-component system sensor histidine kinase NtrB [Bdellovibrionia bacterium]